MPRERECRSRYQAPSQRDVACERGRGESFCGSLRFLEAQIDAGLAVVGREVAVVLLADVLGERPIAMAAVGRAACQRLRERFGIRDRRLDLEPGGCGELEALDDAHLVAVPHAL